MVFLNLFDWFADKIVWLLWNHIFLWFRLIDIDEILLTLMLKLLRVDLFVSLLETFIFVFLLLLLNFKIVFLNLLLLFLYVFLFVIEIVSFVKISKTAFKGLSHFSIHLQIFLPFNLFLIKRVHFLLFMLHNLYANQLSSFLLANFTLVLLKLIKYVLNVGLFISDVFSCLQILLAGLFMLFYFLYLYPVIFFSFLNRWILLLFKSSGFFIEDDFFKLVLSSVL